MDSKNQVYQMEQMSKLNDMNRNGINMVKTGGLSSIGIKPLVGLSGNDKNVSVSPVAPYAPLKMNESNYVEDNDDSEESNDLEYEEGQFGLRRRDKVSSRTETLMEGYDKEDEKLVDNNQPQTILTDIGSSFIAEFSDGYSFRNMIEYLRVTNAQGNFRFDEDGIKYEQSDATQTILNQIEIFKYELTKYEFYSRTDQVIVGVNISDVRSITKTIGKKDAVRLYKKSNDPMLYIQIIHNSRGADRTNVSVVRPRQVDLDQYDLPEYQRDEKHPNFTLPASDFSRACTAISSVKCDMVLIHGFSGGAQFDAMMEGGIVRRFERLGNCDDCVLTQGRPDQSGSSGNNERQSRRLKLIIKNERPTIKVRTSTIKALSKLNNLSSNGTVKFYMEQVNPLKLVCRIGTYGTLRVFIRSYE